MTCHRPGLSLALTLLLAASAAAQLYPDKIYFKFDEGTGAGGTTANIASPGAGSAFATVTGQILSPTGGQFAGCLTGTSVSPTTAIVDSGWAMNLGNGSWTISFWADVSTISTSTLYYPFGDSTVASFRCFYNGAAGVGNVILRGGGLTDHTIAGAGTGPKVVTYVYDASMAQTRGYLDGVFVNAVAQAGPNLTSTGVGTLKVGGYNSSSTWSNGAKLDEFRVWSRALNPAEVAAAWSTELSNYNTLDVVQGGPGIGDLQVTVSNLSPTGVEGFTLLSSALPTTAGSGPVLGLLPDALTWGIFAYPYFPGNPFHFRATDAGVFPSAPFYAPPGSVSALSGVTLDLVVFMLNAGGSYDSRSNVKRYTFQ
jgi:hypothetical protein